MLENLKLAPAPPPHAADRQTDRQTDRHDDNTPLGPRGPRGKKENWDCTVRTADLVLVDMKVHPDYKGITQNSPSHSFIKS